MPLLSELRRETTLESQTLYNLALEKTRRSNFHDALTHLIEAIRIAPTNPFYRSYFGYCLAQAEGDLDRALRFCRQAYESRPMEPQLLVNLGRAEAYLPVREQIRKERYNQGDTIRSMIIEVDKDARGPQIILSRTSDQFLRKLFEQEVPEIFDGDVEIKSIAREPGGRSKIAVFSRSDKVDAVGSCVGMKGSRVQAVVNELHGEKIDIVNWSETSSEFISRALAPAKVSSLRFNEAMGEVLAIVEDDQLSLAIGKEGQNVRLASKLSGWKIDLTTVKEAERRDRLEQRLQMDISEMYGVTAKMAQKLKGIGILTVQKLYKTPDEELLSIDGIGKKIAERLKSTAAETMEELSKALEELLEKEKEEEAAAEEKPLFDEKVFGGEPEKKEEEEPLTEADLFKGLEDKAAEPAEELAGESAEPTEKKVEEDSGEPAEEATEEEEAPEDIKEGEEDSEGEEEKDTKEG